MRNEQLRQKKIERARKRRKDFERRRNINRNVPTITRYERRSLFRPVLRTEVVGYPPVEVRWQVFEKDGSPKLEYNGDKQVAIKEPRPRNHQPGDQKKAKVDAANRAIPMIEYPMPRKLQSKKKKHHVRNN